MCATLRSIVLTEITRVEKEEGKKRSSPYQQYLDALTRWSRDPNVLVHFSDVKGRLGIFPAFGWETPMGVYGFVMGDMSEDLAKGNIPWLELKKRKYIYLFRFKNPERLLDLVNINEVEFWDVYDKLKGIFGIKEITKAWDKVSEVASDRGKALFYLTNELTGEKELLDKTEKKTVSYPKFSNVTAWGKLFQQLGYDGVIDRGSKIIHRNEPFQGFAVHGGVIEVVEELLNPFSEHNKSLDDLSVSKNNFLAKASDLLFKVVDNPRLPEIFAKILDQSETEAIVNAVFYEVDLQRFATEPKSDAETKKLVGRLRDLLFDFEFLGKLGHVTKHKIYYKWLVPKWLLLEGMLTRNGKEQFGKMARAIRKDPVFRNYYSSILEKIAEERGWQEEFIG